MRALRLLLCLALLVFSIFSWPASAASRFMVACIVTCTWDGSSTAIWSGSSGGAPGSSVPGSADTVTLDASSGGGVATVNTTVTVQSITMGAFTGTLDFSVNNNNATLSAGTGFSGTGTGTRSLKLGSGTFNLTVAAGAATPWNFATTTNLTFDAGTSTISLSGTNVAARTFAGGGLTYNLVSFGANASGGPTVISGANTFGTLQVTAPEAIIFPSATTQTVTNAFAWNGSSSTILALQSTSTSAIATISVPSGTATISWASIRALTVTGGATFNATSSFDAGLNTGFNTLTPPSGGGGGNNLLGG